MRFVLLISLLFVSAFQTAMGQQTQITIVTEASSDEMSWNRISTNIVTSSSPKSFYRIRAVSSSVGNNPFARTLVGNYPNTVSSSGISMNTSPSNETLYYNGNNPGGLPVDMYIYVSGILRMVVSFGGNRIGQPFGFSTTANGSLQYTAEFTNGDVYF